MLIRSFCGSNAELNENRQERTDSRRLRLNVKGKGRDSVAAVVVSGWSRPGGDRFGMGLELMGMMFDGVLEADICRISKGVETRSDTGLRSIRLRKEKLCGA